MSKAVPSSVVIGQLGALFHRNGHVRRQKPDRLAAEGARYKKGDEVRLIANSRAELAKIRKLLRRSGFKPGRAFMQGRQWRQPLYGRAAVERFLTLIGPDR